MSDERAVSADTLEVVRCCTDCGGPMVEIPPHTPGGEYLAVACVYHLYLRLQSAERQLEQRARAERSLVHAAEAAAFVRGVEAMRKAGSAVLCRPCAKGWKRHIVGQLVLAVSGLHALKVEDNQ